MSYPGRTGRVFLPLYVRPEWKDLKTDKLNMIFQNSIRPYNPSEIQNRFWNLYNQLKANQLYDGKIFRLMHLAQSDETLNLNFEIGQFSHSVMCQYLLEHELVMAYHDSICQEREKMILRNRIAEDREKIETFFEQNVARIGINNLILMKRDSNIYLALVQRKSTQSMIQHRLFDQISSCIFEITESPEKDFELISTILRETGEELFGQSVDTCTNEIPAISELKRMLQNGSATFEVTGFCIDLIRLVPEITTVLIIQDEVFFMNYLKAKIYLHQNEEFFAGTFFQIPSDLDDVDVFLKHEIISDPDGDPGQKGFDPLRWTLPGGFSFYQGLNTAVHLKLLGQ